ncbi:MAG: nucleoside triphosphate pyrophosphohydrolase [Clostridia bacterium]|nr:nucleoside triphosphate pyrophosphohydrolase [Clostridia bacterium]
MQIHNKLVRDKIPEIINSEGRTCKTRILDDAEFLDSFNQKLQEELQEYLDSGNVEELADLEEVIRAILDAKNISYSNFENIRKLKVQKRGAFKDKILLESVDE